MKRGKWKQYLKSLTMYISVTWLILIVVDILFAGR